MLFYEDMHCIVKYADFVDGAAPRRFPFKMYRCGGMYIVDFQSRFLDAIAEIDVFSIHEKVLVEAMRGFERGAGKHHERTAQCVDLVGRVDRQIGEIIPREKIRIREKTGQPKQFCETGPWCWEPTTAAKLKRAVAIQKLTTSQSGVGVRPHKIHHRAQRVLA